MKKENFCQSFVMCECVKGVVCCPAFLSRLVIFQEDGSTESRVLETFFLQAIWVIHVPKEWKREYLADIATDIILTRLNLEKNEAVWDEIGQKFIAQVSKLEFRMIERPTELFQKMTNA